MKRFFTRLRCLVFGHPLRWGKATAPFLNEMTCCRCGRVVEVSVLNRPLRVVRVIKP